MLILALLADACEIVVRCIRLVYGECFHIAY